MANQTNAIPNKSLHFTSLKSSLFALVILSCLCQDLLRWCNVLVVALTTTLRTLQLISGDGYWLYFRVVVYFSFFFILESKLGCLSIVPFFLQRATSPVCSNLYLMGPYKFTAAVLQTATELDI